MPPRVTRPGTKSVSRATKDEINPAEMDAQLARVLAAGPGGSTGQPTIKIQSTNRSSAAFLYGSREAMYDNCEFLSPELRPVPPQPNCPQSMKIYEDHRQMASEYLRVKQELTDLRSYRAQLQEKVKQNEELDNLPTPTEEEIQNFNQLKEEKDALLAFREKLAEQLSLIEAAQSKKTGGSAHSTGGSTDGWVVVNPKPPEENS